MKTSTLSTIAGVISILAGILAFANPFGASLTVTLLAGWGFLIAGIIQLAGAFVVQGWQGKTWAILWGALATYLGVSLLFNPLEGILTLTLAAGLLFIASGATRLIMSFSTRGSSAFVPLLLSSIVSIILGIVVLAGYPGSAGWLLGTLLSVELIISGIGLIAFGSFGRRLEGAVSGT